MEMCKTLVVLGFVLLGIGIGSEPMQADGQTLCRMTKDGLTACKPSVSGSNPAPPTAPCCAALAGADMQCFCTFKNSKLLGLYGIDPSLAMDLPAKCNLAQSFVCN